MSLDLRFEDVCAVIKKDDSNLIDAVDNLLGLALVCSPALFGPAGLAFLPLLSAKNELIKLGKGVFKAFTGRHDDDFVACQQRMQIAYGLICYTAFFEALDRQLPDALREKFKLLSPEKAVACSPISSQS
jgi:hypothetical protein